MPPQLEIPLGPHKHVVQLHGQIALRARDQRGYVLEQLGVEVRFGEEDVVRVGGVEEVLDAPDTVGWVLWPGGKLLGECADVRPCTGASGGRHACRGCAKRGEVERGKQGCWEDDEAVAL